MVALDSSAIAGGAQGSMILIAGSRTLCPSTAGCSLHRIGQTPSCPYTRRDRQATIWPFTWLTLPAGVQRYPDYHSDAESSYSHSYSTPDQFRGHSCIILHSLELSRSLWHSPRTGLTGSNLLLLKPSFLLSSSLLSPILTPHTHSQFIVIAVPSHVVD